MRICLSCAKLLEPARWSFWSKGFQRIRTCDWCRLGRLCYIEVDE